MDVGKTDEPLRAVKVQDVLHSLAELLRSGPPLGPEAQQVLAEIIDEVGGSLEGQTVAPAKLETLARHVSELLSAASEGEDVGVLGALRDRLEAGAAAVESRAPLLAGLTRRLIETLSEIGI